MCCCVVLQRPLPERPQERIASFSGAQTLAEAEKVHQESTSAMSLRDSLVIPRYLVPASPTVATSEKNMDPLDYSSPFLQPLSFTQGFRMLGELMERLASLHEQSLKGMSESSWKKKQATLSSSSWTDLTARCHSCLAGHQSRKPIVSMGLQLPQYSDWFALHRFLPNQTPESAQDVAQTSVCNDLMNRKSAARICQNELVVARKCGVRCSHAWHTPPTHMQDFRSWVLNPSGALKGFQAKSCTWSVETHPDNRSLDVVKRSAPFRLCFHSSGPQGISATQIRHSMWEKGPNNSSMRLEDCHIYWAWGLCMAHKNAVAPSHMVCCARAVTLWIMMPRLWQVRGHIAVDSATGSATFHAGHDTNSATHPYSCLPGDAPCQAEERDKSGLSFADGKLGIPCRWARWSQDRKCTGELLRSLVSLLLPCFTLFSRPENF